MAKDNSELIDVNSDVKDRVMEVSHIQSLIYVIRAKHFFPASFNDAPM